MHVVMKEINQLRPYKKNAKKHPKEQIERIAESIKEFGFNNPVLIDEHNIVVAGHGRVLAARKLDMKEVPTICLSELTPEQIKVYRLADNKLNESGWDIDLLDTELTELLETDIDMSLFGFDDRDIGVVAEKEKVEFEVDKCYKVHVKCISEKQASDLLFELLERGYECVKR